MFLVRRNLLRLPASSPALLKRLPLSPCRPSAALRACSTASTAQPADGGSPAEPVKPKPAESITGATTEHGFQAETAQLLQIVAKSLYKDKEVFLRELISNAADACEKRRYLVRTGEDGVSAVSQEQDLITVTTDKENKTLTIADSGIGMTEAEVHANLGQIASSGTKAFMQAQGGSGVDLIGQFGVGFYSVFMASDDVKVFTQSARAGEKAVVWTCGGAGGSYSVADAENVEIGTKIVLQLNENCIDFADEAHVKNVIHKYSNFVGTKVMLNNEIVNTVEPLWTLDKSKVTEEQHKQFYSYLTKAWDTPIDHLWYAADAPLSVKALLYIPGMNKEMLGMGRQDAGVSVYCKKILIEPDCEAITPDWLRFIKGVVDSEDMPLNISRETMQDSALVRQLNKAVTGRVIRWLKDIGKKDPEKYKSFFDQFGNYIKEGVCVDHQNKTALLPLLRFSSSDSEEKLYSFDEYVSRMPEGQESIYYLSSPSYKQAMTSPYLEVFQEKGYEVLFLHEDIDEFMMSNLPEYEGKKLVNAEGANLDLVDAASDAKMTKEEQEQLCKWLKDVLGDRVSDVRPTSRLVDSPCVVVNHESATMRKLAKMHGMGGMSMGSRQELEVNTEHKMLDLLQQLRGREGDEKEMAEQVAHQLLDNSLLAAGVLEDSRTMVTRLNKLLEQCLESKR